jgi:uncharacterized protein YndB with AHSA1/START domain
MADILHDLLITAPIDRVFDAVSTPEGFDAWWTDRSSGTPGKGEEYVLWFGPEYDWRARVTRIAPPNDFELEMTRADDDWTGTHVGFRLQPRDGATWLQFSHAGWKSPNEHYRVSSNCWAMYLADPAAIPRAWRNRSVRCATGRVGCRRRWAVRPVLQPIVKEADNTVGGW